MTENIIAIPDNIGGISIDEMDVDGALRESAELVNKHSRGEFLTKAAVGGGALVAGGGLMALIPAGAAAATKKSAKLDLAIANFALTLEYLEAAFYAEAVAASSGFTAPTQKFAKTVASQEAQHVVALKKTIKAYGGKTLGVPKVNFKGTTQVEQTFLQVSAALEPVGTGAYQGAAPLIFTPAVLAAALSIHAAEAQHVGWVGALLGNADKLTSAFPPAFTVPQVIKKVNGTGFAPTLTPAYFGL